MAGRGSPNVNPQRPPPRQAHSRIFRSFRSRSSAPLMRYHRYRTLDCSHMSLSCVPVFLGRASENMIFACPRRPMIERNVSINNRVRTESWRTVSSMHSSKLKNTYTHDYHTLTVPFELRDFDPSVLSLRFSSWGRSCFLGGAMIRKLIFERTQRCCPLVGRCALERQRQRRWDARTPARPSRAQCRPKAEHGSPHQPAVSWRITRHLEPPDASDTNPL